MKAAYRTSLSAADGTVITIVILYDQSDARRLGEEPGRRLQLNPALVDVITLNAEFDTPEAAATSQTAAAATFTSASAATSLFAAAGVTVNVVSTPAIATQTISRIVAGAPMPPAPRRPLARPA